MHPLIEKLVNGGTVITTGAWGTELQARGLGIGDFPDLWNLLHPERVAEVAEAYAEAGSQVILTNTFGANRLRLAGHQLADRVKEINRQGVQISSRAAGGRALVFASIGPSGRLLVTGETTELELATAFEEQASALAEGGADALVVETMADLTEAKIAVAAAHDTGLPVVACMVYDSGLRQGPDRHGNYRGTGGGRFAGGRSGCDWRQLRARHRWALFRPAGACVRPRIDPSGSRRMPVCPN